MSTSVKPWFDWHGRRLQGDDTAPKMIISCPLCGDGIPFSKDGSAHDEMWLPHTWSKDEAGALTVSPSVVCPREGCTWHVVITNGIATP